MKNLNIFLLLTFVLCTSLPSQAQLRRNRNQNKEKEQADSITTPDTINYCTFNIRYADGDKHSHRRCWKTRRQRVGEFLLEQNLSIIGCQEVLHSQLVDLQAMLPDYDYEGVGRENGKTKGEYSPIFWRRYEWDRIKGGTFWLSEHPDKVGSVGWDAALTRIATWVLLENRTSHRRLMCINTHFDHVGEQARVESGYLITRKAQEIADSLPLILTGDLNVGMESSVYQCITHNNGYPLLDTYMEGAPHEGVTYTFHDFGRLKRSECSKIDFIFASPDIKVLRTYIRPEDRGPLPKHLSDHNPIVVRIVIPER